MIPFRAEVERWQLRAMGTVHFHFVGGSSVWILFFNFKETTRENRTDGKKRQSWRYKVTPKQWLLTMPLVQFSCTSEKDVTEGIERGKRKKFFHSSSPPYLVFFNRYAIAILSISNHFLSTAQKFEVSLFINEQWCIQSCRYWPFPRCFARKN